jgi:NADH-quinone oxidoreductase subunit N
MNAWNVFAAFPEWILSISVLAALWRDARTTFDRKGPVRRIAWAGVVAATIGAAVQGFGLGGGKIWAFWGHYGVDAFSAVLKVLFGVTALFVLTLAGAWLRRVDRGHGEFHLLLLFATLGMFFVCSVEDFAALFVSLELITVSFYCLTAFKRNDVKSVEAAVKYVVLGGLASAFLLLGIAFLYGATGSLRIDALTTAALARDLQFGSNPLLQFGLLLTVVGLGFKVAAVPFQVWTPDVYEGAASPVTAFLSMGSKAAGFALLLKVARACLGPGGGAGLAEATPWLTVLAVVSVSTLLYGNLGAMWQGNMKRLLGYSSIGHAGYVLMGVFAADHAGFSAVVYYLMAYLFTVLAVFAVVVTVNGALRSHDLADYAGLGRRSPFLGFVLTCGMLSLAGVPPMAGFTGKFLLFSAVVGKGTLLAYSVAFVGAAGVVISLYYYLTVVKRIYMEEPAPLEGLETIPVSAPLRRVMNVCLAGIFVLGVPGPFWTLARSAASALLLAAK